MKANKKIRLLAVLLLSISTFAIKSESKVSTTVCAPSEKKCAVEMKDDLQVSTPPAGPYDNTFLIRI